MEETSDYADSKLKCFGVMYTSKGKKLKISKLGVMYTSKGKKLKISKLLKDRRILIAQLWAVHQISLDE